MFNDNDIDTQLLFVVFAVLAGITVSIKVTKSLQNRVIIYSHKCID